MLGKFRLLFAATVAVAIAVVGFAVNPALGSGRALDPSCEQSFDRAVDTYVTTTHDRDVDGFASVLHPDVTLIFAGGDVLYGKDQSMGFIREFFADPAWTQTFDELTREVDGCRSGFVLFDSVYTPAPDAEPKPLVIGVTFTYEHGRWLALHNQDSNGPAVGEPARESAR